MLLPILILAASTLMVSCAEEEEAAPVVVAPPPPPPPPPLPPAVKSIADLMKELNIDPRVQLPEKYAPDTTEARIAVLTYFHAIVTGNHKDAGARMSDTDKIVLAELVEDGSWNNATSKLELIELRCGQRPSDSRPCVLAIMHAEELEQPGLWNYILEADKATFDAEPTPPDIASKLSGSNWIESWYAVLDGYLALAAKADETVALPQTSMGTEGASDSAGEPAPPEGGGGGGGSAPMRNRPGPSPGG
ncbi:MAG: hypothetical protein EXS00_03130 [Phycisphaerales bacterium]|nr:hypothetical protein [Phycisphaerales bacterium]